MRFRGARLLAVALVTGATAQYYDIVGDVAGTWNTSDFDDANHALRAACVAPGASNYLCVPNTDPTPPGSVPNTSPWKLIAATPGGPFRGNFIIAGPNSITPVANCPIAGGCTFHDQATEIRLAAELFTQYVNEQRGGLDIAGQRFSLYYSAVEDYSRKEYVTRALTAASRTLLPLSNANFHLGPYSSDLTQIVSAQTGLEGRILIAPGAASETVIAQNNYTFGLLSPSTDYMKNPIAAVAEAAHAYDARMLAEGTSSATPCRGYGALGVGGCFDSLVVGFITAETGFSRGVCAGAPAFALGQGLRIAHAPGSTEALLGSIARTPTLEETTAELTALRAAGTNVLVACTYDSTARTILSSLEAMDWTPHALVTTSSVGTQNYGLQVAAGWWQGEYVLGPAIWYHTESSGTRGAFSNLTSKEFYKTFRAAYGKEVTYHGAATFGGLCALAHAIETAVPLDDLVEPFNLTVAQFAQRMQDKQSPFVNDGWLVCGRPWDGACPAQSHLGTDADNAYPPSVASTIFLRRLGFEKRVLIALATLQLNEFFGEIDFGASPIGQSTAKQLVLQYRSAELLQLIKGVDPISVVGGSAAAVAMDFPMEPWAKRRCRAEGPLDSTREVAPIPSPPSVFPAPSSLCLGSCLLLPSLLRFLLPSFPPSPPPLPLLSTPLCNASWLHTHGRQQLVYTRPFPCSMYPLR